jgi:hypothetical protein
MKINLWQLIEKQLKTEAVEGDLLYDLNAMTI